MKIQSNHSGSEARNEQAARIFLKPGASRQNLSITALEAVLRPWLRFFNPPPATGLGIESVLVFNPGALGDMVLLTPLLRRLREHLPTAHIAVAGSTGKQALLIEKRLIDEWIQLQIPWGHGVPKRNKTGFLSLSWLQFFRELVGLRKRRFDLAFASGWSGDFRGNLAIWLAGARQRVGFGYAGGEFLLTDVVPPDLARPHIGDRNMRLVEHLGFSARGNEEAMRLSPDDAQSASKLLAKKGIENDDLVIGVHPGAGSRIREWGDERFAEVARSASEKFGAKILWFHDPANPRAVPGNMRAISLTLPLAQFAAVVSRCQLFLCNDSGPMHVAAALKVPVVAVFGPQRPEWFGPLGEGHKVVIREDIWCRPCGDQCRWKEPYCMSLISVEQVIQEVEILLKNITTKTLRAAVG
jgi:heptosyltransferase-2